MRFIAITNMGGERILAQEIMKYTGAKPETSKSYALFEATPQQAVEFCHYSQSSIFIGLLDMQKREGSFCVKWIPVEESEKSREYMEKKGADMADEYFDSVDLNNPDYVTAYITADKEYLAIDLLRTNKRDYRIFCNKMSLKGATSFILAKMSGYEPKKTFLNYLCKDGSIAIEAAMEQRGVSVHHYEQLPYLKIFNLKPSERKPFGGEIYCSDKDMRNASASKKNAKIAGVKDHIKFGRYDIEWLDTKYDVDCCVVYFSKHEEKYLNEIIQQIKAKKLLCVFNKRQELDNEAILKQGKSTLYCYLIEKENFNPTK